MGPPSQSYPSLSFGTVRTADLIQRQIKEEKVSERDESLEQPSELKYAPSTPPSQPAPAQMALEHDRTKIAECITAVKHALHNYSWLIEGRGSYEWDDDRWHEEFRSACDLIAEAIGPMVRIAADWSNCPNKWEDVQKARRNDNSNSAGIRYRSSDGSLVEAQVAASPMKRTDFDAWYADYDDTKQYADGMRDAYEAGLAAAAPVPPEWRDRLAKVCTGHVNKLFGRPHQYDETCPACVILLLLGEGADNEADTRS